MRERVENALTYQGRAIEKLRDELSAMQAAPVTPMAPPPVAPNESDYDEDPETADNTVRPAARRPAQDHTMDAFDDDGQRKRVGSILIDAGLVTREQLDEALAIRQEPANSNKRLGAILVEQGYATSDEVAQALASQLQLEFVRTDSATPEYEAVKLVSARLARHHLCFPMACTDDTLTLAMANPLDLIAIEDVELATNRHVEPVVAGEQDILSAVERFYGPSVEE